MDWEEVKRIEKEHKQTWVYNKEYATTFTCDICKAEMPVKFHKDGTPMQNTKLYKEGVDRGMIIHTHRHPIVCYDIMKKRGDKNEMSDMRKGTYRKTS